MKRTTATPLIILVALGVVVGYLLELALSSTGRAIIVPQATLPITLAIVGVVVLGFAIPIRRVVTGASRRRIDPFSAMRVVSLAKASSLAGAAFLGGGIGILAYLVTRPVLPGVASVWLAAATALGGVIAMVAGLVAEHLCRLPKDDDDDEHSANA